MNRNDKNPLKNQNINYRDNSFKNKLFSEDYSRYVKSLHINNNNNNIDFKFNDSESKISESLTNHMRKLNVNLRQHYQHTLQKVGQNVFPLLIALENEPNNNGIGGTYVLFTEDGKSEIIRPVHEHYEHYKSISHIPLGILSIITPYIDNQQDKTWRLELAELKILIDNIILNIDNSTLQLEDKKSIIDFCNKSIDFIKLCLKRNVLSLEEFNQYRLSINNAININVMKAASMQVLAVKSALKKVRDKLGEEKWSNLFVMITTIWPVSKESPREQIFREIMDPDKVDTHLIIAEGVKDINEARNLIGRIVYDRFASRTIFGLETKQQQNNALALSTPIDLMSLEAKNALNRLRHSKQDQVFFSKKENTVQENIYGCPFRPKKMNSKL